MPTDDRARYAAEAMGVLMVQHPDATRGWIKEMAFDMADVMLAANNQPPADASRPFADSPRTFAEDEAEHEATQREGGK